jgi:glycosyltransferase involved in cell wall biosynthesis
MSENKLEKLNFSVLTDAISRIDRELTAQAARAVNASLTLRNWLIGYYIAEYELHGADRAQYGERLLESLAVGVPVACTPLPSLPELIGDPPCGFTIPEKDPAAIADLIKQVSRRPGLLREYGKAGRRKIEEKWDIARTSREIAGLLDGFQDILVGVNVI